MKEIAEAIGKGLKVPVISIAYQEGAAHFGWLAQFAAWDLPASSLQTKQSLGWTPTGPGLITDLENMHFPA